MSDVLSKEQMEALCATVGKESAKQMKDALAEAKDAAEKALNSRFEEVKKGQITKDEFDQWKKEALGPVQEQLKKVEDASKEQGNAMRALVEAKAANSRTFEDYFEKEIGPRIPEFKQKAGVPAEFTSHDIKVAGTQSISGSIAAMDVTPSNPYAPGPTGPLELFEIRRNPNFITNRVDVGRTSNARLAWINELQLQGGASATVSEGGAKPLFEVEFKVEFSDAKKAAAYVEITEEFENDLAALATAVRRMLQDEVLRKWDDKILQDVLDKARAYSLTGFTDKVEDANLYDAILAMMTQLQTHNFIANGIFMNPVEYGRVLMSKDSQGRYLYPPFLDAIMPLLAQSNKLANGYALVGDFTQYKVDIYKDISLRVGWINDNLINNKFCVVAEMRYHSYISDVRRDAIVYGQPSYIAIDMNGTPTS